MQTMTQRTTIDGFVGERTDVPYPKLPPNYLTFCENATLYRGAVKKVSGYGKYLNPMTTGISNSITITRNSTTGIATATITAGHGYVNGTMVLIAGANEVTYNGTFIISNVGATTFDYTGGAGTSATGTITCVNKSLLGAIQAIFRVPLNDGTTRLVIATEKKIYAEDTSLTPDAFIDISNSQAPKSTAFTVTRVSDYGGSKDNQWSGCSFNFSSTINNFILTNYGTVVTPTDWGKSHPQVWNGRVAALSAVGGEIKTVGAYSPTTYDVEIETDSAHGLATGDVVEIANLTTATASINKCWQIKVTTSVKFKILTGYDPGTANISTGETVNVTHKCGNAYVPLPGFRAKIVKAFENHLQYYNIFDGTSNQPYTSYHSNIADPTDWTTGDAGFVAKPEGGDGMVTAEPISIYMAIYKKGSIILETYTGDDLKYAYIYQVNNIGAYSSKSVINRGSEHIFPARNKDGLFDGFYIFNGQSAEIITSSLGIRDKVRNNLNATYSELFVGAYLSLEDFYVWLYPGTTSSTYPDTAIVWNRNEDTWFFWKLNKSTSSYITALIEFEKTVSTTMSGLGTWNGGTWTMGTLPHPMGSSAYNGLQRLTLLGDSLGQAFSLGSATTFDSTAIVTNIERKDFPLGDDPTAIKYVNRVTLRFSPNSTGTTIRFYFSYRLTDGSGVTILSPFTKTLTGDVSDFDIDLFAQGRLFGWQITSSDSTTPFQLEQMIIHYTTGGSI